MACAFPRGAFERLALVIAATAGVAVVAEPPGAGTSNQLLLDVTACRITLEGDPTATSNHTNTTDTNTNTTDTNTNTTHAAAEHAARWIANEVNSRLPVTSTASGARRGWTVVQDGRGIDPWLCTLVLDFTGAHSSGSNGGSPGFLRCCC